MEKLEGATQNKHLKMATEDFYRKQAKSYRDSEAYGKMTELYPLLEMTIKDCQGEKLVD